MGVQVPSRSRCVAFPLLRVPVTMVQGARGRQPEGRCVPLYWFNHPPNRHPVPVFLHIHWLVPGW